MKIRFWKSNDIGFIVTMLMVTVIHIFSEYMKNDNIQLWPLYGVFMISIIYFVPNYITNVLEITDTYFIFKNSVFQKAISIEIETIASINLVLLNEVAAFIEIKLNNGNIIPWYTSNRTQEIYNYLMLYNNSKWNQSK